MRSKPFSSNKLFQIPEFSGIMTFILIVISLFFQMNAYSQSSAEYITSYKMLSVEQGLSSREVFCGLQGKKGFIWLGTRNGLCRYDGEYFRQWHRKQGLQKEVVVQVAQDQERNIWIIYGSDESTRNTGRVTDIMNNYTYEISTFSEKFPTAPFKEADLVWVEANKNNELILFVAPGKIYKYRKKEGFEKVCEVAFERQDLPNNVLFANNFCWVRMPHQFTCIDLISGKTHAVPLEKWDFTPLTTDENGNCTVLSYTTLNPGINALKPGYIQIDTDGKMHFIAEADIPLPSKNMLPLIMNDYNVGQNSSTLYIPGMGIFLFFERKGQLLVNADDLKDIKPFKLHCSYTDRQNQYWITTNNGVFIVSNKKNRFKHYFTRKQIAVPETDANPVRGIYADTSGNVYATIFKNIMWHDAAGNKNIF